MKRPPRDPKEKLFSIPIVLRSCAQGGLALAVIGALYLGSLDRGLAPDGVRSLTFTALIAAVMALVLANRSFSTSLSYALAGHSTAFRYVTVCIAVGVAFMLAVPPVRHILGFATLGPGGLTLAALAGVITLIGCEYIKSRIPTSHPC